MWEFLGFQKVMQAYNNPASMKVWMKHIYVVI